MPIDLDTAKVVGELGFLVTVWVKVLGHYRPGAEGKNFCIAALLPFLIPTALYLIWLSLDSDYSNIKAHRAAAEFAILGLFLGWFPLTIALLCRMKSYRFFAFLSSLVAGFLTLSMGLNAAIYFAM